MSITEGNSHALLVGIGEVLWDMLPGGKQLGGAPANFAYHANALGGRGVVVSRVGDDALGHELLARLDKLKLDHEFVRIDPAHPTGTVDVRIDREGVAQYVIHENVAWDFIEADASLLELAARADAVCFGSLGQRSAISRHSIRTFVRGTPARCLRVLDINLRQHYFSGELIDELLRLAGVLKLNDQELPVICRLLEIPADPDEACEQLLRRYSLRVIALTRGARGSTLYDSTGQVSFHPGFSVEVVDTVGAGDAFTAAMALGLLAGRSLESINAAANQIASFVCSQSGATPPIPDSFNASLFS